jgi:hypothetical protein
MLKPTVSRLLVLPVIIVAATAVSASAQTASDRSGFTLLANLGVGVQNDTALEEVSVGFGGANFGVGGFITRDLAILGRYSGTSVPYDMGGFGGKHNLQVGVEYAPAFAEPGAVHNFGITFGYQLF